MSIINEYHIKNLSINIILLWNIIKENKFPSIYKINETKNRRISRLRNARSDRSIRLLNLIIKCVFGFSLFGPSNLRLLGSSLQRKFLPTKGRNFLFPRSRISSSAFAKKRPKRN